MSHFFRGFFTNPHFWRFFGLIGSVQNFWMIFFTELLADFLSYFLKRFWTDVLRDFKKNFDIYFELFLGIKRLDLFPYHIFNRHFQACFFLKSLHIYTHYALWPNCLFTYVMSFSSSASVQSEVRQQLPPVSTRNSSCPLVKTPQQTTRSISSKPKLEANRRTQSSNIFPSRPTNKSNSERIIRPIQSSNSLLKQHQPKNGTSITARGKIVFVLLLPPYMLHLWWKIMEKFFFFWIYLLIML